jgi:acetyltransferase (GNAT) family protein
MTARELPREEWGRLVGTELELAARAFPNHDARVIVVEESDGRVIGCWSVVRYVHVEGLWIHPDHRKRGRVLCKLLALMRIIARQFGADAVLTGATTDEVRRLVLGVAGAVQLPGDQFAFPVEARKCR